MKFQDALAGCITSGLGYCSMPESYAGIVRTSYPDWQGWRIIDNTKRNAEFSKALQENKELKKHVETYYRRLYDDLKIERINYNPLALELFEGGAKLGRRLAVRMLEDAANIVTVNFVKNYPVPITGEMSERLIERVNGCGNEGVLLKAYTIYLGDRYLKDPQFFRLWIE